MTALASKPGPLAGLSILELGEGVSAPYCGKLLAAMGARVIKAEPPGGDVTRGHGPFPDGNRNPDLSGLFTYLNGGKQSILLDPANVSSQQAVQAIADKVDAVISNWPLAQLRKLGLDYPALKARRADAILLRLSLFGDTGPMADFPAQDLQAQAMSGVSWAIGDPAREPLSMPLQQGDYQAGSHGASALLAALYARKRQGIGQYLDVASADILSFAAGTNAMIYIYYGLLRWGRAGPRALGSGGPYPYVILPCKDGSVCLIGRARKEWEQLVEAMGRPAWSNDPRYQDLQKMGSEYPEEVDRLITPWLMQYTRAELLAIGSKFGFPVGPLRSMAEVVETEQFAARGFFTEVAMADGMKRRVPSPPFRFSRDGLRADAPPPRLGEHGAAVLQEFLGTGVVA